MDHITDDDLLAFQKATVDTLNGISDALGAIRDILRDIDRRLTALEDRTRKVVHPYVHPYE